MGKKEDWEEIFIADCEQGLKVLQEEKAKEENMCIAEPCGSSDMCKKCKCNPEMEKLELLGLIQDKDKAIAELKENIKCLVHNCNVKQEMNDRQYAYGLNLLSRLNKAKGFLKQCLIIINAECRMEVVQSPAYKPCLIEAEKFLEKD
ncbi:MAG: hypothetical protein J6S67_21305 [Methanobrevibacter sp.]|nr:hypothetical protein [Methanobrevibacter sp.]